MKSLQTLFIVVLILAVCVRPLLSFIYVPHLAIGQQVNFETVLLTESTSCGSFDTMTVQYINGFSSVPLFLAMPTGKGLHYGQFVAISGKIKIKVLRIGQPIVTISSLHIKMEPNKKNLFLSVSFFLRQKIQALYEKSFSPRWAALLLGIKINFPKDFLLVLQKTGVVHVIAAEGLNAISVSQFFLGIFTAFLKRQWAIALTIGGLLFYCIVCGLQPSIVRSTIMMGFALLAQLLGRQYSSLYRLVLAVAGMLFITWCNLFDIGFQISFGATLGIIFLKPLLPKWGIFSEDINITIAAQVATLPILLNSFETYGLLSVAANAAILWTIPLLMILGGVEGIVGIISQSAGHAILLLCYPILFFFDKVVTFFASFPWQISLTSMPIVMTIGYYLLVVAIMLFLQRRQQRMG